MLEVEAVEFFAIAGEDVRNAAHEAPPAERVRRSLGLHGDAALLAAPEGRPCHVTLHPLSGPGESKGVVTPAQRARGGVWSLMDTSLRALSSRAERPPFAADEWRAGRAFMF